MSRARNHMDCFTGGRGCWVGDDATCPMRPKTEAAAPFPDGWPTVPAITVTRDGRVVVAAPLMDDRQVIEVGPYKIWVNR